MLALSAKIYPQCFNADFSNADFTNWIGTTGENSGGSFNNQVIGINQGTTNSLPTDAGQQTIINQGYYDPNTNNLLWTIPPGGTSCARLGNENTNYGAERLAYTINVNASNIVFTYQYAVVLEDPGHVVTDQPKFTIYVLDSLQHVFDPTCGEYEVSSSAGITGWQDATHAADGEPDHWKDWTTVGVDLSAYMGHPVTILFTTYDCAEGAHFGYAYIACHCGSLTLQQLCTGTQDILSAPAGFASYSWSTGGSGQTETINNPVNGTTVTCTCTSVQGCTMSLSLVLNVQPVTFTVNSTNVCAGAPATLSATGSGYSYTWSDGQTGATVVESPTTTTTYTVTATASGGCSNTASATVTTNQSPSGTITSTPSDCGASDGSITITPTTGTPPYQYAWNTSPPQNTATASNIPSGTYTVTITDATTCSSAISGVVSSTAQMSLTTDSTDENCGHSNGTATVVANGGLGSFTYTWSTTPVQNTSTATSLPAGTYTVTVGSGTCTATDQVIVNNLPGPSAAITSITNASCGNANGGAVVTASGGAPAYTYQWNSTPPQYTNILQNVVAGNYAVTVTDVNNCTAINTVNIQDLPGPTVSIISSNEMCHQANGSATVTAIGGTGVYTYLWSNGQTTPQATGLTQGGYTVTVNDSNCIVIESVTVGETNGPTAGFSIHPRILTLMDGPVSVLDNSSSGVVGWLWDWGDGTPDGTGNTSYHQYMNLGTYIITLIVTDNNGCTDTVTDSVKVKDIYAFYIPNVFTPNGDGTNDVFTPRGISVDPNNYDEMIFDRWGNVVFHTTKWTGTSAEPWNGTKNNKGGISDLVMDVYVYRIQLKELEGWKHQYVGRISLLP